MLCYGIYYPIKKYTYALSYPLHPLNFPTAYRLW